MEDSGTEIAGTVAGRTATGGAEAGGGGAGAGAGDMAGAQGLVGGDSGHELAVGDPESPAKGPVGTHRPRAEIRPTVGEWEVRNIEFRVGAGAEEGHMMMDVARSSAAVVRWTSGVRVRVRVGNYGMVGRQPAGVEVDMIAAPMSFVSIAVEALELKATYRSVLDHIAAAGLSTNAGVDCGFDG